MALLLLARAASASEPAAAKVTSSTPPPAAAAATPAKAQAPAPTPAIAPLEAASLTLDVILVNDPDFPEVDEKQANAILTEARAVVADKLGFAGLNFHIKGSRSLASFLDTYAPKGDSCLAGFEDVRVRPGGRHAREVSPKAVQHFLHRWKLDELQAFFPKNEQKALTSYEVVAQKLLDEFDRKVDLIAGFKLKSGQSLLAPDKVDQRSYVRWVCAMRKQNEADLVLTNAFILYDLASEPYPHSIFQKCKVGGASLLSPQRHAIRGRAMVASTFSMMTDIPFFREDGIENLLPNERFEVIGAFIVAHELGHALFKLPDFYDHPKECLMTTKYETGYVDGYWYLKAYPGGCSACAPWVEAKRHVFRADLARAAGAWQTVIDELKSAIKLTPKHVDGSYRRYLAELSFEVAEAYANLGKDKEASRWLGSVLKIVPDHSEAVALKQKLQTK